MKFVSAIQVNTTFKIISEQHFEKLWISELSAGTFLKIILS